MTTALSAKTVDFGVLLRDWRQHRRMSQLNLSAESGISQRHISFLETGRSNPSRGMVLALSDTLDIPLRERNTLLQRAGFTAAYSDAPLDDENSGVFQAALQASLEQQEPYPAMVLDGRWNLVMANTGAMTFFAQFINFAEALTTLDAEDFQIIRICLSEQGLKPFIVNWNELTWAFLQRARRALLVNPRDEGLPRLIEDIVSHPDAPSAWQQPDWGTPPAPAISMVMEKNGARYALFTMLAHFGAAQSVTLEELSVELFYPADEATKRRLQDLAA